MAKLIIYFALAIILLANLANTQLGRSEKRELLLAAYRQGQKESDDDNGSNYNNFSPDVVDQESDKLINDEINGATNPDIKPPTDWRYETDLQEDDIGTSNPTRRSESDDGAGVNIMRAYWNRLFYGDNKDAMNNAREKVDQNEETNGMRDQSQHAPNDEWRPTIIQKQPNGGGRQYDDSERQHNMLRKSSLEIDSDSHSGYTQQRSYTGSSSDDDGPISDTTNHQMVLGDGDEAIMSHLEGYSRKYRLPADYGFAPDDVQVVHRRPTTMAAPNDLYFIVLVAAFCGMAITVVISAGLFAFRVQQGRKVSSESDYPTYGVVGPSIQNKGSSPPGGGAGGTVSSIGSASKSSGSLKSLADILSPMENGKAGCGATASSSTDIPGSTNGQRQYQANQNAARMYHYQHQKQQMLSTERVTSVRHTSASDLDSDEENEEGNYTVYECPGLASTHEMEVKNPLFQDDPTPVGSPTVTK